MVTFCSLPVALSLAATLIIPFASISKVTSTCGMPRGAGGMPSNRNLPRVMLSFAIARSPCRTWMSTAVWLSSAVENTSVFFTGMVVLRSINLVITPPRVSTPNESGVTSSNNTSLTSPAKTPPWIAAPTETTSSGLTPLFGSLPPVTFRTNSCTIGMRVAPPTKTTSSILLMDKPASLITALNGVKQRCSRWSVICSNFARVSFNSKCFGPLASAVMYGRLISVSMTLLSSILAFSAASRKRCRAWRSLRRSIPWSCLNSSAAQLTMTSSQSSPPRWVSPLVAFTSTTPPPTSSRLTSNVPPPRSNTRMISLSFLSKP